MTGKEAEPDEMRMPADKFEEIMRQALGAPLPSAPPKAGPKPAKRTRQPRRPSSKKEAGA